MYTGFRYGGLSRRARPLHTCLLKFWATLHRCVVNASGLFDVDYYRDAYPDVAASGMDPVLHYCEYGWREGRRPGPLFAPELPVHRVSAEKYHVSPALVWWLLGRRIGQPSTYPEVRSFLAVRPAQEPVQCDIVFVVHECTRTGAPLFLLSLARWLRDQRGLRIRLIILACGPLLSDFCAEFDCILLYAIPVADRERRLRSELRGQCGMLYFNSIASLAAYRWLAWFDAGNVQRQIVIHCHESPSYISAHGHLVDQVADLPRHFISVTKSAADALEALLVKGLASVSHLPPAVTISPAFNGQSRDKTLILGCGTASLRKGADLFCRTARQMLDNGFENFRMVWIGGAGDAELPSLINKLGLAAYVSTIGEIADPRPWFEMASLLFMASREDPFPLACLEAAERGLPTICFDSLADGIGRFAMEQSDRADSSIFPDFTGLKSLRPRTGPGAMMIPAFDIVAMANAIIELLQMPSRLAAMGVNARQKIELDHDFTPIGDHIAGLFAQVGPIRQMSASSKGR